MVLDPQRCTGSAQRRGHHAQFRRRIHDAEEAMQRSEEHYRVLAQNAPDVIFRCSLRPQLEVTYLSPATVDILGHIPQTLLGPADRLLALVDDADRVRLESS